MSSVLASLKYSKANFKAQCRPEDYLFRSLALTQRTAEKQVASALDLVATFGEAVRLRKMSSTVGSRALRDMLGHCVADYNKSVVKAVCLDETVTNLISLSVSKQLFFPCFRHTRSKRTRSV